MDAGSAGGGNAAGGSAAGGSAAGGSAAGGAAAGGSPGAFDAGRLNCTFESPIDLGDGVDSNGGPGPTALAMTEGGEVIYAWVAPRGLAYRVQSPTGVLSPTMLDADAGAVVRLAVAARGHHALLAYVAERAPATETFARRYLSDAGWTAPELVRSIQAAPGAPTGLLLDLESDGAASLWLHDVWPQPPILEFTSAGTGPFSPTRAITTAGFVYSTARAAQTRLAVALEPPSTPAIYLTSGLSSTRLALSSAVPGNYLFHSALADDGTAATVGLFTFGAEEAIGAVVRSGGTLLLPERLASLGDGGVGFFRPLAVLAGPGGLAAFVWARDHDLFLSRRVGGQWSPPTTLATMDGTAPRFSLLSSARGLVHYFSGGTPQRLEVTVDGSVSAPVPDVPFPGIVYGNDYRGAGSMSAAISTRQSADGGWVVMGAQCR